MAGGGGGHMQDMVARIRDNDALIKRKRYFKPARHIRIEDRKRSHKPKYNKTASPQSLDTARLVALENNRERVKKSLTALGIAIAFLLVCLFISMQLLDL